MKKFKNLKVLMLEHFHDSNENAMSNIGFCKDSLKTLTLALCPFYSSTLLNVSKLTNLETLDLSSNASVNDGTLKCIGTNCRLLKRVDLSCKFSKPPLTAIQKIENQKT